MTTTPTPILDTVQLLVGEAIDAIEQAQYEIEHRTSDEGMTIGDLKELQQDLRLARSYTSNPRTLCAIIRQRIASNER